MKQTYGFIIVTVSNNSFFNTWKNKEADVLWKLWLTRWFRYCITIWFLKPIITDKLLPQCVLYLFLDRNYHILEPSNQDDVSETGSSVDKDEDWGELAEYHTLEDPDELNDDQGQDSTFAKRDITELSGKSLSNLQQSLSEGDIMKACRKEPSLQRTFSERATCRKKCCIQIQGSCYERDTMKACKKEPSLQRSSSERTPFSSERDIMQACRKGPFLRRSSSERDTMKACRKGPSLKRSSSERDIIYVWKYVKGTSFAYVRFWKEHDKSLQKPTQSVWIKIAAGWMFAELPGNESHEEPSEKNTDKQYNEWVLIWNVYVFIILPDDLNCNIRDMSILAKSTKWQSFVIVLSHNICKKNLQSM